MNIFLDLFIYACYSLNTTEGPGGSMSQVVGLPNNSYQPITNTTWVRARLCKLQKGCTRLTAASDKGYQLLAHGQWFAPGTLAFSNIKTGRHDIAEILLKVALNKNQSLNATRLLIRYIMLVSTCFENSIKSTIRDTMYKYLKLRRT